MYTCVNDACPNYGGKLDDPGTGYAPECPVCHALGGRPEPDLDQDAAVHWGEIGGDLEDQEDIAEVVELAEEKAAQIVGITPGEVKVNATAAGTSTTVTVTVPEDSEHTSAVRLLMEPPQTPGLAVSRTRAETGGRVTYELTFTNTTTAPIQAQAIGYTLIG